MTSSTLENFVVHGVSPWHVAEQIRDSASLNQATVLDEKTPWKMQPSTFYLIQRGCSCIAVKVPQGAIKEIRIAAVHTDSPALKVKPLPISMKEGHPLLQLEPYGAPILSSWIGRDLRLAGLILRSGKSELVDIPRALFIPHIAFHLDRTVNETGHLVNKHEHLFAFVGSNRVSDLINDKTVTFKDLYAVSDEPLTSFENEQMRYFVGPRLDNLACLAPVWNAFLEQKCNESVLKVFVAWNHEEIGSQTEEGALSPFLSDVLERILSSFGHDRCRFLELKAHMKLISCDVAHGYHPNYPEKYDLKHTPVIGSGVAIKNNPNMRYSQNVHLREEFGSLLQSAKIPFTEYSVKNDMPAGSTVGPLASTQMGIATIDIGVPLIGMHSIREVVSEADVQSLGQSLGQFYNFTHE